MQYPGIQYYSEPFKHREDWAESQEQQLRAALGPVRHGQPYTRPGVVNVDCGQWGVASLGCQRIDARLVACLRHREGR